MKTQQWHAMVCFPNYARLQLMGLSGQGRLCVGGTYYFRSNSHSWILIKRVLSLNILSYLVPHDTTQVKTRHLHLDSYCIKQFNQIKNASHVSFNSRERIEHIFNLLILYSNNLKTHVTLVATSLAKYPIDLMKPAMILQNNCILDTDVMMMMQ